MSFISPLHFEQQEALYNILNCSARRSPLVRGRRRDSFLPGSRADLPQRTIIPSFQNAQGAPSFDRRCLSIPEVRSANPILAVRAPTAKTEVQTDLTVVVALTGLRPLLGIRQGQSHVSMTAVSAVPVVASVVLQIDTPMTVHVPNPSLLIIRVPVHPRSGIASTAPAEPPRVVGDRRTAPTPFLA